MTEFISFVLLFACVALAVAFFHTTRINDKMRKRIAELEHDNARLEMDSCRLARSLTTAKRLLSKRGGYHRKKEGEL